MMQRAVKTLQPFEFRNDFGPQAVPAPAAEMHESLVTVTPAELAGLLAEARREGLEEGLARNRRDSEERLQSATSKLNQALANLVALAGHLEASAFDSDMTDTSMRLINATARRIIDGQGDMFADRKDLSGDTDGPMEH